MQKYNIELSERFKKEFRKLDKYTQKIIRAWIAKNLINCEDPRVHGKALTSNLKGHRRYRIGDYRIITLIEDDKLIITALTIGHRRKNYKR